MTAIEQAWRDLAAGWAPGERALWEAVPPPSPGEGALREEDLLRVLHALAVAGAGSALLDRAAEGLERLAGTEVPVQLPRFGDADRGLERFVAREWATSDWFYGIAPRPEEG